MTKFVLSAVAALLLGPASFAQLNAPPGPRPAPGSQAYVPAFGAAGKQVRPSPLQIRFEQSKFYFDPATPTETVWVDVTNGGLAPVSLTHFSSSSYVLPPKVAPSPARTAPASPPHP